MLRLASALFAAFTAAVVANGCVPSRDLGVGTGGAGSGGAKTTTHTKGTGGSATTTSGTGGAVEPSGPTALTVVNGINDYDAARFCFLPGDTPWPAAAGGLPFATGQSVDLTTALPQGVDVTPWVIAGDLTVTAGMTCTQMLALAQPAGVDAGDDGGDGGDGGGDAGGPPPPIVAAPLGVIPKSVLASDRSLLLVPTGCMGGSGHDDPGAAAGCGMGYSSQTPTTGVVLLGMSRIANPQRVSLQVVSASPTLPAIDVRVLPSLGNSMEVPVASSLSPGAIAPDPPFSQLPLAQYGSLGAVQLKTYPPNSSSPTSATMLSDLLTASGVGTAGFIDGASLVLVALGGSPGAAKGPFWHAFTLAMVRASPP